METETRYYLKPQFDSRKSFYNKAEVYICGDTKYLYSYDVCVARISNGNAVVYGTYSNTTLRHIKEFLKQNEFFADTKAQIIHDYREEE